MGTALRRAAQRRHSEQHMATDPRFRYLRAVLSLRELYLCQNEMFLALLCVDLPAGGA